MCCLNHPSNGVSPRQRWSSIFLVLSCCMSCVGIASHPARISNILISSFILGTVLWQSFLKEYFFNPVASGWVSFDGLSSQSRRNCNKLVPSCYVSCVGLPFHLSWSSNLLSILWWSSIPSRRNQRYSGNFMLQKLQTAEGYPDVYARASWP